MTTLAEALEVLGSLDEAADLRNAAAALGKWFGRRESALFDSSGASGANGAWAPLARSTLRRKRKLSQPTAPLIRTGAMRKDFAAGHAVEAYQDRVVLGPEPGTSKAYAFWAARNMPHRDPTPGMTGAEHEEVVTIIGEAIRKRIRR